MGGEAKGKLFEFTLLKQVKGNYSLIPLVLIGAFGVSLSAFQIIRTLSRSPDVSINRVGNPRPYERFITEDGKPVQYKYFSTVDYNKLSVDRPKL
jgi:hypothetical protein